MRDGRKRVVIEAVTPEIDHGRFPAKRTVGDKVVVEADVFADGHDLLSSVLLYRYEAERTWRETPMESLVNDRWRGVFPAERLGRYCYTIQAWVDPFKTWQRDLRKRADVGQVEEVDLVAGAELVEDASRRAKGERVASPRPKTPDPLEDAESLNRWSSALRAQRPLAERITAALDEELLLLIERYPDRRFATTYEPELVLNVDRDRAGFSSWYELFPRSWAREPGQHGTFEDVRRHLPYVASMGFDVLYLPPIHPIGSSHRKGKNNAIHAAVADPGSPWAIGAKDGGHKAVHPQLGTLQDFQRLVSAARDYGIEIALDLAFQCTPDHPYVSEHPEWFRRRADGSIQYAENPPKKYQDIYPLDFENERWQELWDELKSVALFWIDQGVRIFRVDNPHTKPFPFWEWWIREIQKDYPELIFLAEAFTRPKVMRRLAKLGFTQSYSYFAWRNAKWELTEYFTELTQSEMREYFRPNLWPNTPDILTEHLQFGGRPAFMARLVLAATLGANYGIYGPAFELCENRAREPGSEEYLDSEKYEIRRWDLENPDSLKELIGRINRIRKENPALQSDRSLRFHEIDNDQMICYSKETEDGANVIVVVVNLDPHHVQTGRVRLRFEAFDLEERQAYQFHDLLTDARYLWHGRQNTVVLNPHSVPAHIFRVRRHVRREQDFDYFM
ncbi:MAG TPA: alpha-1,4-glucan--maltose-1-phosphate maltosyltransferase [Candidatus Binatia bacterium]|nr:alpha-1,4-glucan--maltose-1-phosphate maltosyltransferase [Candidatus Binatia bacterium]